MAILKSVLEEPLLTREQASVIRVIAHAAQLNEALNVLSKLRDIGASPVNQGIYATEVSPIESYIHAELKRVLTQVKIPRRKAMEVTRIDPITPFNKLSEGISP
jgi:hypothetical protein